MRGNSVGDVAWFGPSSLNPIADSFRAKNDIIRFSYPADHTLAAEFEEQMIALVRKCIGQGEYLAVHHAHEQDARDDAPDSTALALFGAAGEGFGEILFS